MPDNRRIRLDDRTLTNGETCRVEVSYPTLRDMRRVYSVSVQPVEYSTGDGYRIERYTPSRGYRATLAEAPRYSRSRLEAIAADPVTLALVEGMIARVEADVAAGRV